MLRRILFCAKRKTLYSTLTLTLTLVLLFINNQVGQENCFLCFRFHKIGSEGATALVTRLAGRLRTSRIVANGVQVSAQETLAYEGVVLVFVEVPSSPRGGREGVSYPSVEGPPPSVEGPSDSSTLLPVRLLTSCLVFDVNEVFASRFIFSIVVSPVACMMIFTAL